MGRVGHGRTDGANFRAPGRVKISDALDALVGVDFIRRFPFADSLYRAFRLAGSAADAFIRNLVSHSISLLIFTECYIDLQANLIH
jgi:hypothetical protein